LSPAKRCQTWKHLANQGNYSQRGIALLVFWGYNGHSPLRHTFFAGSEKADATALTQFISGTTQRVNLAGGMTNVKTMAV
jgi:hypothetical protein